MTHYGATKQDWMLFDMELGLTEDLLPVVSNPNLPISPKSDIGDIGKTPSSLNQAGFVSGIYKWTQKRSTPAEVSRWILHKDYGICLQTRWVRALDIDVADKIKAAAIAEFIEIFFKAKFPTRFREGSGKCLIAFKIAGEMPKRVMKVDGGIIEFLANGQQFIAAGTHTSGTRYQWDWNGHVDFPEITLDEFNMLWAELGEQFAIEAVVEGSLRRPDTGNLAVFDDVLEKLEILGWGPGGQAHIKCPFAHEHTTGSSESSTSYFPKGTRGYELGHFKCLHAHCAKRTDADFLDALELRDEFEVVEAEDLPPVAPKNLARTPAGVVKAVIHNLDVALHHPEWMGYDVRYDDYQDSILIYEKGGKWRAFEDEDVSEIKLALEHKAFEPIPEGLLKNTIRMVARRRRIDTAKEWLNSLKWDGIPRIDTFLRDCLGAEDTPYTIATSRYMWTALAGRTLQPGVKADMALILKGDQGVGKSTAISELTPFPEMFGEVNLQDEEADIIRQTRGKSVLELSELRGLHSRDMEHIKSHISRRVDEWIPKYMEHPKKRLRRSLYFGTTNKNEFLADDTGNRRWLPFIVHWTDILKIREIRDQLWAEAAVLFRAEGVLWRDADRLCRNEHADYMMSDVWEEIIAVWLGAPADVDGKTNAEAFELSNSNIFMYALGKNLGNIEHKDNFRLASVMKKLGYHKQSARQNGKIVKDWVKNLG